MTSSVARQTTNRISHWQVWEFQKIKKRKPEGGDLTYTKQLHIRLKKLYVPGKTSNQLVCSVRFSLSCLNTRKRPTIPYKDWIILNWARLGKKTWCSFTIMWQSWNPLGKKIQKNDHEIPVYKPRIWSQISDT